MGQSIENTQGERTAWATQYDNIKEVLDSIAYEVVQKAEYAYFYDKLKLGKVLLKAEANYDTFVKNQGYERLEMYNGVRNVENKKQLEFNPYRWLRARNLSESNEYYIDEVYE